MLQHGTRSSLARSVVSRAVGHVSRRWRSSTSGIIGLPNVGKSTLFNALTNAQHAQAANYPFCTIEPNEAVVAVEDAKLEELARVVQPEKVVFSQLWFTDIAGLVAGAHKGEGLGNKFLSHIRDVSLLMHVLRCYDDEDIVHVSASVDPVRDAEVVEMELMLADMQVVETRLTNLKSGKKVRGASSTVLNDDDKATLIQVLERAHELLDNGQWLGTYLQPTSDEQRVLERHMNQLLTNKPMCYVCNVDEDSAKDGNDYVRAVEEMVKTKNDAIVVKAPSADQDAERNTRPANKFELLTISSQLEAEACGLADEQEKHEFLQEVAGLSQTSLQQVVQTSQRMLDLQTFYTIGKQEARAWQIPVGCTAAEAAGKIHTDLQRGFIRAEVIKPADWLEFNGESGVKEAGRLRVEGKDYIVEHGDIMHIRFNV